MLPTPPPIRLAAALGLALVFAFAALPAPALAAQEAGGLGSQTLGRGYLHMFVAYGLAWILVLGWAVSIARRLARVERKLED